MSTPVLAAPSKSLLHTWVKPAGGAGIAAFAVVPGATAPAVSRLTTAAVLVNLGSRGDACIDMVLSHHPDGPSRRGRQLGREFPSR
ncbi:hypothetical protein GCM10010170_111510 [Dactylosporangium salmoneum]|uniref:Uncharacterized protein n=1 Tax=Dactylosporangium salmoneum TaxID=53361 RepID=A0ABP5V847_9ACTN